jgi:hypothetical protein
MREREFQPAAKDRKSFDARQESDDAGRGLKEGLLDEQRVERGLKQTSGFEWGLKVQF